MRSFGDTAPVLEEQDEVASSYQVQDQELSSFRDRGFVKLGQISPPSDAAFIRQRIQQLFDRRAGHEEGLFFDFAGNDEQPDKMRLPQLLDVRNFAPELIKTTFFRNAAEVARQLLGPDAAFKADHALLKPSRDGAETSWHQDDAFRNLDHDHNEISIWLALQDTDRENGCLGFVPTTSGGDILPHRWVGGDGRIHALECHEGWSMDEVVWCPLRSGDCSVHSNRIVHGAGPNVSARPRMAYVLVFGTPPVKAITPRQHPWLQDKVEPRLQRRRRWLHRGGFVVHAWRRFKQLPEIGVAEMARRVVGKLRAAIANRGGGTEPTQRAGE